MTNPTKRRAHLREAAIIVGVLFAFSALFQLLAQIQVFRSFEHFVYPWDGVLWLFGDGLLCIGVVVLVRRRLERHERSTRYFPVLLLSLALFVPLSVVEQLAVERFVFGKTHTAYTILRYAAFQTSWHLIVANGYIAYRYLSALGHARRELAVSERNRAQMELRQLQRAVAPHFLFNSLNILHALILDDRSSAAEFTARLARLYRYLLRYQDTEVVPLREELDFVRDYAYLIDKRFGSAWNVQVCSSPPDENILVVPAAIQTLVENAVKHNVAEEDRPLKLQIVIEGERLRVRNDRRPKRTSVGAGTGLALLSARYARLNDRDVRITETDALYEVSLPLLRAV